MSRPGRPHFAAQMMSLVFTACIAILVMPPILEAFATVSAGSSEPAAQELIHAFSATADAAVVLFLWLLKVLLAVAVAYGWMKVYKAAVSSPYPVLSVPKVHGRTLPVEEVDLGDHDYGQCLTCSRHDGPGVRRGYVEELVVLGVPIREVDRSETYDCITHTDTVGLDVIDEANEDDDQDALDLALDHASNSSQGGDGE